MYRSHSRYILQFSLCMLLTISIAFIIRVFFFGRFRLSLCDDGSGWVGRGTVKYYGTMSASKWSGLVPSVLAFFRFFFPSSPFPVGESSYAGAPFSGDRCDI